MTSGPGRKSPATQFLDRHRRGRAWQSDSWVLLRRQQPRARRRAERARQNLQTSTAEIASTLNLAIQHEQDLAISAGAFIIENPNASESSFIRWVNNVDAFARYPEILAVAEVEIVRPSQLKAFAASADVNEKESQRAEPDVHADASRQATVLLPGGRRARSTGTHRDPHRARPL